MNDLDVALLAGLMLMGAFICWLLLLHILTFRRVRALEQDNYRLIRRLGMYYSISLGTPEEALPQPVDTGSRIPPYFRMKSSPVPPPPGSINRKADL